MGKLRSELVPLHQQGVSQVINLPLKSAPLIPLPGAAMFARVMARGFEDTEYACDGFGGSLSKASNLWVANTVCSFILALCSPIIGSGDAGLAPLRNQGTCKGVEWF